MNVPELVGNPFLHETKPSFGQVFAAEIAAGKFLDASSVLLNPDSKPIGCARQQTFQRRFEICFLPAHESSCPGLSQMGTGRSSQQINVTTQAAPRDLSLD